MGSRLELRPVHGVGRALVGRLGDSGSESAAAARFALCSTPSVNRQ